MKSTNLPSSIFIIGAAKCGTTALADMLDQHSNIVLSEPKESDYFTNRVFSNGFDWYNSLFKDTQNVTFRLDASVSYSIGWGEHGSEEIAKRIYDYDENAILIYLVRDPVARAWSSYWHDVRNLKVKSSPEESILDPDSAHYRGGMYFKRLSEYLKYFSRDNILVFSQSTLINKPEYVLKNINNLLKLESLENLAKLADKKVNASYQFNKAGQLLTKIVPIKLIKRLAFLSNRFLPSQVNQIIRKRISKPIPEIDKSMANQLVKIYKDDAEALYKEFGVEVRNGEWWESRK